MASSTADAEAAPADGSRFSPRAAWENSSWPIRAIFIIALIGTLEAAYLTYVHYNGLHGLICAGGGNGPSSCEQVQSSSYAKLVGIPVALLGLLSYLTILASLKIRGELGRALGFLVSLVGFGFSMYLTSREIFTLKEICEWCVGSATWMTLLLILNSIRYLRGEPAA